MTFDDPSLLAAIREQPGDDNLRLVYSDWLEDHNQLERAEFIRLQCANPIEISPFGSPFPATHHTCYSFPTKGMNANTELVRQFDLYTKYVRKWNGAIHRRLHGSPLQHRIGNRKGVLRGWSYRRGFPCSLWIHADIHTKQLDWVQAIGPVERLIVFGANDSFSINRFVQTLETHPIRSLPLTVLGLENTQRQYMAQGDQPSWLTRLTRLTQLLLRR